MIASIPLAPIALGYYVEAVIHEAGHAVACVSQGDSIVRWRVQAGDAGVDCSRNNDPMFVAGGLVLGTLVWLLATPILKRYVFSRRWRSEAWFWLLAFIWIQWSGFCLGDLLISAGQAVYYAHTGSLPRLSDAVNFIRLTGAAPHRVIVLLFGPFVILLLFIFLPCFATIVRTGAHSQTK
jgi:hypothetical protein